MDHLVIATARAKEVANVLGKAGVSRNKMENAIQGVRDQVQEENKAVRTVEHALPAFT